MTWCHHQVGDFTKQTRNLETILDIPSVACSDNVPDPGRPSPALRAPGSPEARSRGAFHRIKLSERTGVCVPAWRKSKPMHPPLPEDSLG